MTDVKQAVLSICLVAVATGLFRMLVPDNKFKTQLSFLISCIFALCIINSVKGVQPDTEVFVSQSTEVIDFSDKLSENARIAAARSVRLKVENLLSENQINFEKVYTVAHIDGAFCISISEIELVFKKNQSADEIDKAIRTVQKEVGSDIIVKATQKSV